MLRRRTLDPLRPAGSEGWSAEPPSGPRPLLELLRSQQLRHAILDSLPHHVAVVDPSGAIREVNAAWSRFAVENGASSARFVGVGSNYLEVCRRAADGGDLIAADVLRGIQGLIAGDVEAFDCEYPCPGPDRDRWFRLSATALAGSERWVLTLHEDVTDRRARLEALHARVEQQSEVSRVGMAALHEDLPVILEMAVEVATRNLRADYGKVLELLPGGEELLLRAGVGWNPGCVGRRTIAADPSSQAGYTLESSTPVIVEDLRTEGRFRASSLLLEHGVVSGISVVIDGHRGPFGVFGVHSTRRCSFSAQDVAFLQAIANTVGAAAERKRAEAALEEARRASARRERLADVGALAARIVHDIGNPLAGLSMSAQAIQRTLARDDGVVRESVERGLGRILSTTKHLDGFVSEFKQFLREQRLQRAPVSLPELLGETVDFWRAEARERRIDLVLEPTDGMPPLQADSGMLRRILDNLVKNALEAIDVGPGRVTLGAERRDASRIGLWVADSGPGVAPGVDPFALFETTKPCGTGLGLSIVKQIAMAHGGDMEFETGVPRGARFRVTLPIGGPA